MCFSHGMIVAYRLSSSLILQSTRNLRRLGVAQSRMHRRGDGKSTDIPDHHRPLVTEADVRRILTEKFQFDSEPDTVTELLSYGDRNFLVTFQRNSLEEKFVFKVLNPADSAKPYRVYKQAEVCTRLHSQGFSCPQVLKTRSGNFHKMESFPVGKEGSRQRCMVRVLTFVPGQTLGEVKLQSNLQPAVLGALMAQMHTTLQDFPPDNLEVDSKEMWSLENTAMLSSLLIPSQSKDKKTLLKHCLKMLERALMHPKEELQKGVIHGDFHDYNLILLDKDPAQDLATVEPKDAKSVLGIIDFAEISHSCLVFDLALLMCDKMVTCPGSRTEVQGEASGHVLAGYLSCRKLGAADLAILTHAVLACLSVYVIYGEYEFHRQPDNPYVKQGSEEAWAQLQLLQKKPHRFLEECWSAVLVEKYSLPPLRSVKDPVLIDV